MIRNIQLLRAVAAILVVICHSTGQWGTEYPFAVRYAFAVGFTGVDLFFVISGFVIASVAARDLVRNEVPAAFRGFAYNRLARIFPIYWVVIFAASVTAYFTTGSFTEGADVSFMQLVTLTGVSPALGVAWTLQFELLFYAIVGAVMLFGPKRFLPALIGLLSTYGVAILVSQVISPEKSFFANPIILDFLFGVLVFAAVDRFSAKWSYAFTAAGTAGMVLGTYMMMSDPWGMFIARPFYLGVPSALLLYGMIGLERKWSAGGMAVLLGNASYSIYLWHGAVFHQIRILDIKPYPSPLTGLAMVVATVIIGVFSYLWVEKLIGQVTHQLRPRRSHAPAE